MKLPNNYVPDNYKKRFYAIIDIEKRARKKEYILSPLSDELKPNTLVELFIVCSDYDNELSTRLYHNETGCYYLIPDDCYTVITKEKNPEVFL